MHCQLCDKILGDKWSLNAHIETQHKIKKNFKCELCDFTPKLKSQRQTHLLVEHFMEKLYNFFQKRSPYKCIIGECVFETFRKEDLQDHYIIQHNILESFMKEALAIKNHPS